MSKSVLIIGASRGIGLGFAKAYAADGWEVHATTRTIDKPGALGRIKSNLTIHNLDIRDGQQIAELAYKFKNGGIDIFIHNAGVNDVKMTDAEIMNVNSQAPFNVIKAIMPAILHGDLKKIAILTSQMGARNGGATPVNIYGKSKCELNDRFREIELTWRKSDITAVIFHPGWVATDMGGRHAPLSVDESVQGMRKVIAGLSLLDSGSFLTWKGTKHPW